MRHRPPARAYTIGVPASGWGGVIAQPLIVVGTPAPSTHIDFEPVAVWCKIVHGGCLLGRAIVLGMKLGKHLRVDRRTSSATWLRTVIRLADDPRLSSASAISPGVGPSGARRRHFGTSVAAVRRQGFRAELDPTGGGT